ncbi:MAG TPA: hypothetical protein VI731_05165 [Bacteroidia bacterium]|nr:hypothetical protein [Bacteroidia bacterium]
MKKVKLLIAVAGSFLLFQDCREEQLTNDPGYAYFPDNIGHYCIYEVDSTVFRPFYSDTVHIKFQLKEKIESWFIDNQGRRAMRVEQYKRPFSDTIPYENLSWALFRIVSFTRTNSTAEKTVDNQRFINLTFVPREAKTWNGNAYNTIGEWNYEYLNVDVPYSLGSLHFDSTLWVEQKLDTNKLTFRIYRERYARHVGMIEREVIDVRDTTLCCGSVLNRIYEGVSYSVRLVSWGQE